MRWRTGRRETPLVTIYEHIRSHLPPSGPGLLPGGEVLPDEDSREGQLKWAAGALEGVASHVMGFETDEAPVKEVFDLIRQTVASKGRLKSFGRLYEWVRTGGVLPIIDPLLDQIRHSSLPPSRLRELGVRLATESRHREPVKLGISLIGLIVPGADREILMTLGRHEEFTLFSAVALQATEEAPDRALWELAKAVDGWGRIHVVERLAETGDPDIKAWILREGFRNSIMDEYLAYLAATTGDLVSALEVPEPDDDVLAAACDIISALLVGGPAEDIEDYRDAPRAVELLVGHLDRRASDLSHFLLLNDLEEFLGRDRAEWAEREGRGWPPELRERLIQQCRSIRSRQLWPEMAMKGLDSDDPMLFEQADRAARALGMDTFEAHWRRLSSDPLEGNWYAAMQVVDEERLGRLLELARQSLPLEAIASGPAEALGLGPEFRPHQVLGFIVQDLKRFPGRGWELVATALRSPVVANRNMALNVLEAWGRDQWPQDAASALERAAADEPRDDVRERIGRFIRGEPLDPEG
jgi:hypothetical protein